MTVSLGVGLFHINERKMCYNHQKGVLTKVSMYYNTLFKVYCMCLIQEILRRAA